LYDLVADYPRRGGKAIRPALCLAACVAFGGGVEEALPTAAAIEILHNAFLVHDDIEDGSLLRRGGPTLHAMHGVALAINAGDALAVLAQAALRDNRSRLSNRMAAQILDEFDLMARRTLEGQATELGWRRDNTIDLAPEDYLDLVLRKTCWYTTIHPLRVGALIGSWGAADLDNLVRFGFYLGAAFQIADDVLNLTGDTTAYGKEPLGDLYEGKRTLMVIHLLRTAGAADRADVVAFLAMDRARRTAADVQAILDLMVDHGSLDFARAFGEGIAAAATAAFDEAFGTIGESADRRFMRELVPWMLDRPR
jgi:geranylgeranyl diphosphate synthase type II